MRLLVIPDQEDFDLNRIIPATVSLLMIAAGNEMVRLVRELLARGADLDARNENA